MDPRSFKEQKSNVVLGGTWGRSRSRVLLTTVIRFFLRAGLDGTVLLIIFFLVDWSHTMECGSLPSMVYLRSICHAFPSVHIRYCSCSSATFPLTCIAITARRLKSRMRHAIYRGRLNSGPQILRIMMKYCAFVASGGTENSCFSLNIHTTWAHSTGDPCMCTYWIEHYGWPLF